MVNEYFHQVSSTFEAAQCILFPILFTPIISQNCRHCKALRLLSSINAISSPSCVFKLQNPIVLHCLISPLKNWDVWSFFYDVNSPIEIHNCNSFYELQKNLSHARILARMLHRGVRIFSRIHLFATKLHKSLELCCS